MLEGLGDEFIIGCADFSVIDEMITPDSSRVWRLSSYKTGGSPESFDKQYVRDYLESVKFINLSGADICVLEHEFGIYGGQSGIYILPLLHRLEIPLIVTLHTILKAPSYNEKAVLQEICKMANKVVVMSHTAIKFLTSNGKLTISKLWIDIEDESPSKYYDSGLFIF